MTEGFEFCAGASLRGRTWTLRRPVPHVVPDGVPAAAAALAAARGFDDLESFFSPTLKACMPDPSTLKGMDDAVRVFCDAVQAGRRMALYGDYDVDGATSTALVLRWLHAMGADPVFYIPDRLKEGYGPNADAIRRLREAEGVEFLLVLDSGTTAHGPLGVAAELGMEIVILDHHEPDDRMPPGTLVNPKRRDEDRSLAYLCTAGIAFLFLVAVQREMRRRGFFGPGRPEVDLRRWLGIVALGTIADVVPLVGLNRAYVSAGLPRMGDVLGIRALSEATGEKTFTTGTCGFKFGPCINASGRIGDTRLGTMLLATEDLRLAETIARELVETNRERQDLERSIVDSAVEMAREMDDPVIVLANENWHPGVVGLVASRVKDAMNRPAVIIGAGGTASCRSVEGFDIGQAVIAAREAGILIKGGGHAAAAGLTVAADRIDDLRAFLSERASGFVAPPVVIDVAVPCGSLDLELNASLARLQPFGAGNSAPKIAVVGGRVKRSMIMAGKHLRLILSGPEGETEAKLWRAVDTPLGDALIGTDGLRVDVLGEAVYDEYGGRPHVYLRIEDAMVEQVAAEELAA